MIQRKASPSLNTCIYPKNARPLNHSGIILGPERWLRLPSYFLLLDTLVDLLPLPPLFDSVSRKSLHSPPRLTPVCGVRCGDKKSLLRLGVLGVRFHGEIGVLKLGFDVPGLDRPADSRCSSVQFRIEAMI